MRWARWEIRMGAWASYGSLGLSAGFVAGNFSLAQGWCELVQHAIDPFVAVGTAKALPGLMLAPLLDGGVMTVALGLLGAAVVAAIVVLVVRSRRGELDGTTSAGDTMPTEWTEAQHAEWRRTLDALDQLTNWWVGHSRKVRQAAPGMTSWQAIAPDLAYATWSVLPASTGAQAPLAVRATYERLLSRLTSLVRIGGADPATLWKNEALAMTRGRSDLHSQELGNRLRDALDAFRRDWQGSLRALSLLAPVASADAVGHVLWFTPEPAATRDVFETLEQGVSGRTPVVLRSEATDRTVRLSIGHDVPFTQLSTMSSLK